MAWKVKKKKWLLNTPSFYGVALIILQYYKVSDKSLQHQLRHIYIAETENNIEGIITPQASHEVISSHIKIIKIFPNLGWNNLGVTETLIQISAPTLPICMRLNKSLNFSNPRLTCALMPTPNGCGGAKEKLYSKGPSA